MVSASKCSREVEECKSKGRWADRCRGIGHQLPTASDGPQAGRWRLTSRLQGSSTCRSQIGGNKARMSMKAKDKYKMSLSCAVPRRSLLVMSMRRRRAHGTAFPGRHAPERSRHVDLHVSCSGRLSTYPCRRTVPPRYRPRRDRSQAERDAGVDSRGSHLDHHGAVEGVGRRRGVSSRRVPPREEQPAAGYRVRRNRRHPIDAKLRRSPLRPGRRP